MILYFLAFTLPLTALFFVILLLWGLFVFVRWLCEQTQPRPIVINAEELRLKWNLREEVAVRLLQNRFGFTREEALLRLKLLGIKPDHYASGESYMKAVYEGIGRQKA